MRTRSSRRTASGWISRRSSPIRRAVRALFHRWPAAQSLGLGAADLACRLALLPFRRPTPRGRASEAHDLVARTDAFNEAAERYFATFPDPAYLLDKPFSEAHLTAKHLIDTGVLIEAMRLRPGDVVAELGAGSGWLSHFLNRYGCTTIALDVSPTAVQLARTLFERDPRTNWAVGPRFAAYDGHRLPLDDGSCDRVVINDAFHHVPNQRELLLEMLRVLRADGAVAMSEPGRGHAATDHSAQEAASGVLENELHLEDVAALAKACGFKEAKVVVASPHVRREIPASELGAFMGGRGVAEYWKAFCSALEQHHYIVLYKGDATPTTRRPASLAARIRTVGPGTEVVVRRAQPWTASVRVTNIGDTRWLRAEGCGWTRVGAHLYGAATRDIIDFDWCRGALPHDVDPGGQVGLTLQMPAIASPGEYLVVIDMVVEGHAWFADRGSAPASIRVRVAHAN